MKGCRSATARICRRTRRPCSRPRIRCRVARGDGVGRRRHCDQSRDHGSRASGLLLATDVADYLVAKGVPFREAHEIVGALVRRLVKRRGVRGSLGRRMAFAFIAHRP